MSDSNLYEDNFRITELNHEKYDRVGRVSGTSADNLSTMTLDINSDVYPLAVGDNIQMQLVSTLNLDGSKDEEEERGWREKRGQTLADMFDYVCYGKVYKFEESEEAEHIKVFVSFGGLLLFIQGPYKKLTPLRVDHVYLLIKK